ncbi:MAG: hypothetical protein ACJ790_22535 [Myxococcaceae bacterium]
MAVVDVKEWRRMQRRMFAKGANAGVISPPLFGLPWKRMIPADVHGLLDYKGAAVAFVAGAFAGEEAAVAGAVLGASRALMSAFTDYRMSLAKLLPIAVHEVADYVWGVAAIAAPFVLGYARKAPKAAVTHILLGASTILSALVTDYRAKKGVHWPHSATLPEPIGA